MSGKAGSRALHGNSVRQLRTIPPLSARTQLRFDNGRVWAEVEGVFAAAQDRVNTGLMELSIRDTAISNLGWPYDQDDQGLGWG